MRMSSVVSWKACGAGQGRRRGRFRALAERPGECPAAAAKQRAPEAQEAGAAQLTSHTNSKYPFGGFSGNVFGPKRVRL